jgi:DNA adenine methylase
LLPHLRARLPAAYGRYVEPFVGGGALFFALAPGDAVIGDANPELINLYRRVATEVEAVIGHLSAMTVSAEAFYAERARDWRALEPARAAARTIYLNKTCFNGLYRVNRQGAFNVPFGRHATPPRICDAPRLRAAAARLARATIVEGDWRDTVDRHAGRGDLVFLDPPYLPVSPYSDFKRYTATQFGADDHRAMAPVVERLRARGCHVVLTNANHPLLAEIFPEAEITVVAARRAVNCRPGGRRGEDAILTWPARRGQAGLGSAA